MKNKNEIRAMSDDDLDTFVRELLVAQCRYTASALTDLADNHGKFGSDDGYDDYRAQPDLTESLMNLVFEGTADDVIDFLFHTEPTPIANVCVNNVVDLCPELLPYLTLS